MNIQPITNNVSMQAKPPTPKNTEGIVSKIKQKMLDIFPIATFKDDASTLVKRQVRDANMSHPAINRAIMGATAIALQPPIDCFNKSVDEDTRRISVCRTLAKIIAGTTVGIVVRGSCHKLVEKMTDLTSKGKFSKSLIPKKYLRTFIDNPALLKNYRSALSTGVAILAMCFTNFIIDAPLTVKLTNKFKSLSDKQKPFSELKQDNRKVEVEHG